MSNPWHPDESQLLAYADAELPPGDSAVQPHIESCRECQLRVAALREVLASAGSAWRSGLPPPPQPWADLRPRLNKLDAGRVRSRRPLFSRVDFRWVAAAAAVVAVAVIFRLASEQTVSAAELLHQAAVREAGQTSKARNIRVRTRRANWVRPAARPSAEVEEAMIAAMFRNARYNWDEPLSARSFSEWRSSLPAKDDRVRVLQQTAFGAGRFYEITTITPEGDLAQASITIRAADLRPVQERFEFRNSEFVEVAEEFEAAKPLPRERLAENRPALPEPETLTAGHELQVLAALHAIGADLGEPVEVARRERSIQVTALITDAERQQEIRTALSGLRYVDLRFDSPEATRSPAAEDRAASDAEARGANPVQERLASKLGGRVPLENFTNQVLDLSDSALARAHALRLLAQKFPPEVESQLSPRERETLASMQKDHTARLLASVRALSNVMRPLGTAEAVAPPTGVSSWHELAGEVLDSAQGLDRAATETLAAGKPPAGSPDEALGGLARAAANLQSHAEALQKTFARSGGR